MRDFRQVVEAGNYLDSERENVNQHTKRLFWATDWTKWDRFNLTELAAVHAHWRKSKLLARNGKNDYPIPPIPFRILLHELTAGLAAKVSIAKEDVENYPQTLNMVLALSRAPTDSASPRFPDEFAEMYIPASKSRREDVLFAHLVHAREADQTQARWPGAVSVRPGWEDLPVRECGLVWTGLFDGFLEDWQTHYESDGKYRNLRAFSDYLFLYLNWWCHRYEARDHEFPQRPGQVQRYIHIKKGAIPKTGEHPLTFQEFLLKRFPSAPIARAGAMHAAMDLFDWVIEEHKGTALQADLFEEGFQNPIRAKDFHYKGANRRRHARIRLGKRHAELLCDYLLGIEAFFTKLECDFLGGDSHSLPLRPIPTTLEAEAYGYIPVVFRHGRVLPIEDVPAAYNLHTADFVVNFQIDARWPNLSSLRLLCLMMETGLRGAHIRWLGRESLSYQDEKRPTLCKRIYVNTDKAGSGFPLPVSDEAYSILGRQLAVVTRILAGGTPEPVLYMGRKHSRFDPVDTLFYASSSTRRNFGVLPDSSYRKLFRVILALFGEWLREQTGEEVELVTPRDGEDMSEILAGSRRYATEQTESIYTPHSIRSTVISERMSVLPIRLVGLLAGHRNEETTAYYHQVDEEELHRLLNQLPMEPVARFGFSRDDPAYIQSALPNSALRRALDKDRKDAEMVFGFTTVTFGDDESRPKNDGLTALRIASDASIAYFDTHLCPLAGHCPKDVVDELKEPHRCGLCRYAVKSVDQLPAIRAKIRSLESRARAASKRAEQIFRGGSHDEAQRFFDAADMDATEALGWHLAETVLEQKLLKLRSGSIRVSEYHVDQPEMLKRHLVRATLPKSESARILQRISECNAYPSMQDEEVRQIAARLKRIMLGAEEPVFEGEADPVAELCSHLATRMDAQGISTTELIRQLDQHRESLTARSFAGPDAFKQLVRKDEE
ncbi:hypothetical protein B1C78_09050 [Thioalkalivibrio denitrificans]|uniref:Integrase n=1 Tax=Thioalkalivibrio denitrificans TaxID=108003 RepID=A0A1V3NHJ7_9GAMM|nr:hypothetical protein B1C78_09050 [Thioalkalivibrio denitrificans]